MNTLTRQNYLDSSIDQAERAGMDSFQLKYDGWWTRCESLEGSFELFSQTERSFKSGVFSSGFTGRLIGEYMQGTQWAQQPEFKDKFFIFDIWELRGVKLNSLRYRDRYTLLASIRHDLPDWCVIVANYPITQIKTVWADKVESGKFEGVVFRNQDQLMSQPLLRIKRDIEDTYLCTGFVEGVGKHAGRLGALVIDKKTDSGEYATVGGGFDDSEREHIWANQTLYLNKKFDVVGKHRFESGLLRHPNFLRWKD